MTKTKFRTQKWGQWHTGPLYNVRLGDAQNVDQGGYHTKVEVEIYEKFNGKTYQRVGDGRQIGNFHPVNVRLHGETWSVEQLTRIERYRVVLITLDGKHRASAEVFAQWGENDAGQAAVSQGDLLDWSPPAKPEQWKVESVQRLQYFTLTVASCGDIPATADWSGWAVSKKEARTFALHHVAASGDEMEWRDHLARRVSWHRLGDDAIFSIADMPEEMTQDTLRAAITADLTREARAFQREVDPARVESEVAWRWEAWEKVRGNRQPQSQSLQCCEHARQSQCVCHESRFCPIHGKQCVGTHD